MGGGCGGLERFVNGRAEWRQEGKGQGKYTYWTWSLCCLRFSASSLSVSGVSDVLPYQITT